METETETYTIDIETLLAVYVGGLISGITTSVINLGRAGAEEAGISLEETADAARRFAQRQVGRMMDDPAMVETCRDAIREKLRGEDPSVHLIHVHTARCDHCGRIDGHDALCPGQLT